MEEAREIYNAEECGRFNLIGYTIWNNLE